MPKSLRTQSSVPLIRCEEVKAQLGSQRRFGVEVVVAAVLFSTFDKEPPNQHSHACIISAPTASVHSRVHVPLDSASIADGMIDTGHGGSISDPITTSTSTILERLPFGMEVEVDKGFLIEYVCALLGVICIRLMKMINKQTQQSKADTGLTQKVRKTRIAIGQCNDGMKLSTNLFDTKIKVHQIGLADLIFRSGFLLQNFTIPFIHERGEGAPMTGRPPPR